MSLTLKFFLGGPEPDPTPAAVGVGHTSSVVGFGVLRAEEDFKVVVITQAQNKLHLSLVPLELSSKKVDFGSGSKPYEP